MQGGERGLRGGVGGWEGKKVPEKDGLYGVGRRIFILGEGTR